MQKLHLKLLTDDERVALAARLHRVRVRKMVLGVTFIGFGMLVPEFQPHIAHEILVESVKSVGYIPILQLFEGLMFA